MYHIVLTFVLKFSVVTIKLSVREQKLDNPLKISLCFTSVEQ